MHHSVDIEEIKNILAEKDHKVKNIYNIKHKFTKEQPLSLYYIDLKPTNSNKKIFDIQFLQNAKVKFESP